MPLPTGEALVAEQLMCCDKTCGGVWSVGKKGGSNAKLGIHSGIVSRQQGNKTIPRIDEELVSRSPGCPPVGVQR
jgi:hypothetical protein